MKQLFVLALTLLTCGFLATLYMMWDGRRARRRLAPRIDRSLHTPDDEGFAPLPIDPANPPTIRYYRPKKDNPRARRTCHCHGKVIEFDQEVVWWPLPDGSVRLLCKDAEMKGVVKEEPA